MKTPRQKTTRRALAAQNAELRARLDAAKPESRQTLRAKVKASRDEADKLAAQVKALRAKYEPEPETAIA